MIRQPNVPVCDATEADQGFNSPLPKNPFRHFIFGLSPLPLPSFHKTMGVVTFGETENKPGSPQVILET